MKFRSCFNIFEVDEPLEQALPTDDIDFIGEEVDVIVDEEIEQENKQLRYQVSRELGVDIDDIQMR